MESIAAIPAKEKLTPTAYSYYLGQLTECYLTNQITKATFAAEYAALKEHNDTSSEPQPEFESSKAKSVKGEG
jgi:hypothetical protein